MNALIDRGMKIVTDSDELVHVSGHPRRSELQQMYQWVRPEILVPVHGEAAHLVAHGELARASGIRNVPSLRNGQMLRLAPGPVEVIDEARFGRVYKDGRLIGDFDDMGIGERRKLSFVGHVAANVLLDSRYELVRDPDIVARGLPAFDDEGEAFGDILIDAAIGAVDSIPRARRKDIDMVKEAVRRAIRAEANAVWGKKPMTTVFLTRL